MRQSGSHKIYRNENGVRITVPFHSGKTLHPKIIKNIITCAELTEEDLKSCIPPVYLTGGGMQDVRITVIPVSFANFKIPLVYDQWFFT